MLIKEEDITLDLLIDTLRNAFFDISDIEDDRFTVKIHKYTSIISLSHEQKLIRITSTDRIADYNHELFARLLTAVNEANASMINVSSFILPYEDDEESMILLRVDQHISFYKGLIMEQFVRLLRDFEDIDVHIFQHYMLKTVQEFEENQLDKNTLLS